MKTIDVRQSGSLKDGYVKFYIIDERGRSASEMSAIDDTIWFYNRLIVNRDMRDRGYGSILLSKTVEFCKVNNLNLLCGVNPYGDLDFDQLRDFYIKHGFQETENLDCLELKFADKATTGGYSNESND